MRESVAWALVRAWEKDLSAFIAIKNALLVEEGSASDETICAEVGADYIWWSMRARPFMATRFKPVSDALWDGVAKAEVVTVLMGCTAAAKKRSSVFTELRKESRKQNRVRVIQARSLDKRHDWATVK